MKGSCLMGADIPAGPPRNLHANHVNKRRPFLMKAGFIGRSGNAPDQIKMDLKRPIDGRPGGEGGGAGVLL